MVVSRPAGLRRELCDEWEPVSPSLASNGRVSVVMITRNRQQPPVAARHLTALLPSAADVDVASAQAEEKLVPVHDRDS